MSLSRNKPTDIDEGRKTESSEHGLISISGQITSVSPLPSSDEFAGYERTLSGAADRILSMAEHAQEHNHKMQSEGVNSHRMIIRRNFWLDVIGIVLVVLLAGWGMWSVSPFAASSNVELGTAILWVLPLLSVTGIVLSVGFRRRSRARSERNPVEGSNT